MAKISEDFESMAHEIRVLKLVKKAANNNDKYFPFLSIKAYGTFVGLNVHSSDINNEYDENIESK